MKNQISKTAFLIAIGLVVLLSVTSANAETVARFQIPFRFLVGDNMFPAGDYVVKIDNASRLMSLNSWNASTRLFLTMSAPHRPGAEVDTGKLIFHKYGNVYVLRQMWKAGASWGYDLPKSNAEREISRKANASSTQEIASVYVYAK